MIFDHCQTSKFLKLLLEDWELLEELLREWTIMAVAWPLLSLGSAITAMESSSSSDISSSTTASKTDREPRTEPNGPTPGSTSPSSGWPRRLQAPANIDFIKDPVVANHISCAFRNMKGFGIWISVRYVISLSYTIWCYWTKHIFV